ncbi:WD40 repeat-like protein [Neoconidiobolus thromboides FSU 785]|nr:WD40 repeat-like protein [Neoconidiobolus thromboides FSU 785]
MLCTISGEIPSEPVISIKSGQIYEKSLIEKYLPNNQFKEPITNYEISLEDLIPVKQSNNLPPRPPTMSSIPSLLSVFQNEWDSVMLEVFTLKQQYQQVRQQLSHALYQNDASARVIARLIKERDEARKALTEINETIGAQPIHVETNGSEQQEIGLSEEIVQAIQSKSEELSKQRKKRATPEGMASPDQIASFTQIKAINSLHSKEIVGINSVQFMDGYIATGGNDGKVQIYNVAEDTLVYGFEAAQNKIKSIVWCDETKRIFAISETSHNVVCWNPIAQDNFSEWTVAGELPGHNGQITSFSLNPIRKYGASTSLDGTWRLIDTFTGEAIVTFNNSDKFGYTCGAFHPDGVYFATGTENSVVQIWDVSKKTKVIDFEGHTGAVTSISFSENGYYLATTSESNECKLWDLRKLNNFKTIQLPATVSKAKFDQHGLYLAVLSEEQVAIFKNKSWSEPLVTLQAPATDLQFSPLSDNVLTVSKGEAGVHIFGNKN